MDKNIIIDSKEIIDNLGKMNNLFSGKKILLTGCAGFLGSQFVHYFAQLNALKVLSVPCELICVDNFIREMPDWLKDINDFTVTNQDITRFEYDDNVDYIIHAASIASPMYYRLHPIETMDANIWGLRNLLDFTLKHPCKSFLFFSSSEVYGDPDPDNIPTKEDYRGSVSFTGPRACYDESKRFGETLCINFWQQHQVPIKIARPFNNYGPGLHINDKRVLPDFFKNVINGEDITLFSNGRATRTFCYTSDAITGYLQILLSGFNGESFNIGTEKPEISMSELAEKVLEVSRSSQKIIFKNSTDTNYLKDNPNRRCPDITKAKNMLGYSPKIDLEAGLLRTFNYYMNNNKSTIKQGM